jgi:hypothetical protein
MSWVSLRWGALLLTSAAIFLAGYKVAEWRNDAARLAEYKAALQALEDDRRLQGMQSRNLMLQNLQSSALFRQEEAKTTVLYQNTIKKVVRYVPNSRNCDVPAAAIGMRNDIASSYSGMSAVGSK